MPFRLGLPTRKFLVKFYDPNLEDELTEEFAYLWYCWHGSSPEDILDRAQGFAALNCLRLICITEVLWEEKNDG